MKEMICAVAGLLAFSAAAVSVDVPLWPAGGMPSVQTNQTVPFLRWFVPEKRTTVVTMRYRTPRPQGLAKHVIAWQDAQRTVRLVRSEAAKWGLNPDNIGFTGCSAGGHLAVMVAVLSQTPAYRPYYIRIRLPMTNGVRHDNDSFAGVLAGV